MVRWMAMAALVLSGCAAKREPYSFCEFDGGASAHVALTLIANFGLSGGCGSADPTCNVVWIDGGTIFVEASAWTCSTGCSPGGVSVSVPCSIPPLAPGTYEVAPYRHELIVVADGGGNSSCSPFF